MHVGGGDIGGLLADVRRRHGGAPVVFLLQEAYREGPEVPTRLEAHASFASMIRACGPTAAARKSSRLPQRLGLHAYYVPSMRNGAPAASAEDRGNAILSTLPLTDLRAIELPFERQRRVAVAATVAGVTARGRRGRFASCRHISTTWSAHGVCGLRVASSAGPARRVGWSRRCRAATIRSCSAPISIPGSASATAPTAPPQRVPGDAASRIGAPRFTGCCGSIISSSAWTRDGGRVPRADNAYGSDHYPLIGQIRFD